MAGAWIQVVTAQMMEHKLCPVGGNEKVLDDFLVSDLLTPEVFLKIPINTYCIWAVDLMTSCNVKGVSWNSQKMIDLCSFLAFLSHGAFPVWFSLLQQQTAVFIKQAVINPLCTTCSAPNSRNTVWDWLVNIMDHVTAKETDIFLRRWWTPNQTER